MFFLENLKLLRKEVWVQNLTKQAIYVLNRKLDNLNINLRLIQERCEDEDWTKIVLDLAYYKFWFDEEEAWHWLIPRFVESLAYSRELRRGLLSVAERCESWLSRGGQKRLKILHSPDYYSEDNNEILDELGRLAKLGWLVGDGENELYTILYLRLGESCFQREQYSKAMQFFEQAEARLCQECETLRLKLAQAWKALGDTFEALNKLAETIFAFQRAVALDKTDAHSWHRLGHMYDHQGYYQESIAAFKYADELEPNNRKKLICMAVPYRKLGRYEEAISIYKRALLLAPKSSDTLFVMAEVYRKMGHEAEYMQYITQARENISKESKYNQACFEAVCGNVEKALELLEMALKSGEESQQWARNDPDFDRIRDDPRFKALVNETTNTP